MLNHRSPSHFSRSLIIALGSLFLTCYEAKNNCQTGDPQCSILFWLAFTAKPKPPCNPCQIFVMTNAITGQIDSNLNGNFTEEADSLCSQDSLANNGFYKAMLVGVNGRRACMTPDCSNGISEHNDWVIYPSTQYVRAIDGQPIATSITTAGIFSAGVSLLNSTNPAIFNYWTGLNTTWEVAGQACNQGIPTISWASTASVDGVAGDSTSTGSNAWSASNSACSTSLGLLCIEQ